MATPVASPASTSDADPRWRFFTDDTTHYFSPWYAGAHRIMIGFGCTTAPYYGADARCSAGQGFHHGIDVAIPCGGTLLSAVEGRVVLGGVGAAYGSNAFRLRTADHDLLIGHAQALLVGDGDRVAPGQPIAEVGALGAPDGCHLHLEQRSIGGGLSTATDPTEILALAR
jgi:murein DD-endopeptidase MepM/ murein hydrolase activator NlpD